MGGQIGGYGRSPETHINPVNSNTRTTFHYKYEVHGTVKGRVDSVEEKVHGENHPSEVPNDHVTPGAVWEIVDIPVADDLRVIIVEIIPRSRKIGGQWT